MPHLLVVGHGGEVLLRAIRSVFKISNLFLRPRPWQFEIRDSTDT